MPPVYPQQVTLRFPTRACPWTGPSDATPEVWTASTPTALTGVQIGTETYTDTALALFEGGGSPSNAAQLQELADRFAADLLAWRQTQLDETIIGVAAVRPTGLFDTYWDLDSRRHATRLRTMPHNLAVRQLGHQVAVSSDDCPDGGDGQISTKTPCVEMYGPPAQDGSSTTLTKWLVCIEDGRIVERYEGQDVLDCGCKASPCPCDIPCSPVPIPAWSLLEGPITLTFTQNPAWDGGGGDTGPYELPGGQPGALQWGYACGNPLFNDPVDYASFQMGFNLSCNNNEVFIFMRLAEDCEDFSRPTCGFQYPPNPTFCPGTPHTGCVPLALVDWTASPFHLHFKPVPTASPDQPVCDGQFPFTDMYLDAPATGYEAPYFCVSIIVVCGPQIGGSCFVADSTITLTDSSGNSQTKNTGIYPFAVFNIGQPGGTYTITVENDLFPTVTVTRTLKACNEYVNMLAPIITEPPVWPVCCGNGVAVAANGVPLGPGPLPCYGIPPNLTLTGVVGTIPFNWQPQSGWFEGCGTFDADNIVVATLICFGLVYVQLGSGQVAVTYIGHCVSFDGQYGPGTIAGQFVVFMYFTFTCIEPLGYFPQDCQPGDWYLICPEFNGNFGTGGCQPDGQCVLVGCVPGQQFLPCCDGDVGPGGNAAAYASAAPSSLYPFAWSAELSLSVPVSCFVAGGTQIPCPLIPDMSVSIEVAS